MKLVIQEKDNGRFKVTVDFSDGEVRLKLMKGATEAGLLKAKELAEFLCRQDFSNCPVMRGRFNESDDSVTLYSNQRKTLITVSLVDGSWKLSEQHIKAEMV